MAFFGQLSVIYWLRNTKSEAELVFRKHYILSPWDLGEVNACHKSQKVGGC